MRLMTATLASSTLIALLAGCTPGPNAVTSSSVAALPPAAKAVLSSDAQIVDVKKATYDKGGTDYLITYRLNNELNQILYADYHETTPTYVFEKYSVR